MEKGIVSIIVPCYKQAQYLAETLDSVLAQTYKNWECIIINDGSPDNCEEIANIYIQKDKRIKYVWQENSGVSAARNNGISHSNGEYILPLDADDIIESSYIEKAINRFISFPETKLVYCKADTFGVTNGDWCLDDYDYEKIIWGNCIFCSALFRRIDYDQTNGYNVNMVYGNEDWDFWLSLLKKDDIVYRIDEVLFHYRTKSISRTTELPKEHLKETLIQICKNHPDIYSAHFNEILYYQNHAKYYFDLLNSYNSLIRDYKKMHTSLTYRIGRCIMGPILLIKRMFNKHLHA